MVKNLNITGLHWKIFSLGEDQLLKKGGLGQFADFGVLGKKGGGWYPHAHYNVFKSIQKIDQDIPLKIPQA